MPALSLDPRSIAPYRIVASGREHVAAIAAIEQAAALRFPHEDLPGKLRYRVTDGRLLQEARRDGRLWVAVDAGDRPVGFALAEELPGELYLCEIDVLPDHGQRGIGTQLVASVVDAARSREFAAVSLITFRHLPWNAPFYEKLGFRPIATADLGPELAAMMSDDAAAGIDTSKRVAMRLILD
ncbi:MAG TPA: GNAT family N-acetyltransferase [Woeseiaceae bacterium]|nr:GNAT family N-acetyltransferase [Woeseiaceae bacterium]